MKLTHDFEHMPGALFCKDLEGRYLWCNQGMLDMLRCESPDQVLGKDDWELLADVEQVEQIKAMDQAVIEQEEVLTRVEHLTDAAQQWVTYRAPLRDEFGTVIGVQGCSLAVGSDHMRELRSP